MPKLLKSIFLISLFLFFCSASIFAAEEITITTYYPSPYGSYNSLQTDKLGVGDNDGDGSLTSADVPTTSGDVWIKGKVGIGTTGPSNRLTIKSGGDNTQPFGILDGLGNTRLDVRDGIAPDTFAFRMEKPDGTISIQLSDNADSYFNGGNVGIGTTSPPIAKLDVAGTIKSSTQSNEVAVTFAHLATHHPECDASTAYTKFLVCASACNRHCRDSDLGYSGGTLVENDGVNGVCACIP